MKALGDRMKHYENAETIDRSKPYVMRLDGHKFSTFTKGAQQPYDYRLHRAFAATAGALMKEYGADAAFTHSDEISLFFYPRKHPRKPDEWREPHYGGKAQKLVSTAAGLCTMRFNRALLEELKAEPASERGRHCADSPRRHFDDKVRNGEAFFDCRVFNLPDDDEMFSYFVWRTYDCERNHVAKLARTRFSKKQLHGVSTKQQIELLARGGVVWENEPACFRRGTLLKKKRRKMPEGQEAVVRYDYMPVDVGVLTTFSEDINATLKCKVYEG